MREVDLPTAIEVLRRGEILVYPTETFYGLGVDIAQPKAQEALFRLKGREAGKAVSLLLAEPKHCEDLLSELSDNLLNLINKFLPGPLTIVARASAKVPKAWTSEGGWVGLRVSPHPLARQLAAGFGGPLTTTSANPSGAPSARSRRELEAYFGGREDVYFLPGGDLPPSQGSTVVRVEGDRLVLLRAGDIPFAELEKYWSQTQA
ncbi:threonylcarbamoyl-AMP synthase [Deltaproteobacteria bacterium PRO3]|nr:threonylcarbamoyl-AMP synthase [Deltaproteobacteria bacterium PRO3]